MTATRPLVPLFVAFALPATGVAWERTVTCYDDPLLGVPCADAEEPIPLAWTSPCVGLHLNVDSLASVGSASSMQAAAQRAASVWNDVDNAWISLVIAGQTDEYRIGFSPGCGAGQNANIIALIEEDWAHARAALALTTVTYYPTDGRILDADIELNGENYEFAIVTTPFTAAGKNDLENTLTHELGHLLGIDHTQEETFVGVGGERYSDATMFAETDGGEISKRTLLLDDRLALQAAYPDESAPDELCEVDNNFFDAPSTPPGAACEPDGRGCASTRAPDSSLALVALAALVRRRRKP